MLFKEIVDGRTSLPMGICWVFLLFKTTQQANNYPIWAKRNEWKVLTDGHLLGILVPNKCPSVCPDRRTDDGQRTPDIEGSQKLTEHFVLRWAKNRWYKPIKRLGQFSSHVFSEAWSCAREMASFVCHHLFIWSNITVNMLSRFHRLPCQVHVRVP